LRRRPPRRCHVQDLELATPDRPGKSLSACGRQGGIGFDCEDRVPLRQVRRGIRTVVHPDIEDHAFELIRFPRWRALPD
jgi:hypothetical protein